MAPGSSQPFATKNESVISSLAMQIAQLSVDLAVANDQINQLTAARDAAQSSTPAAENA